MKKGLIMTALLAAANLSAQLSMPKIFGDNMVLQQGMNIPIWGKAAPGEKVVVKLGETTAETIAGDDGKWTINLAPQKIDHQELVMTVSGEKNTLEFKNVLIGNVWLCSGQSNMAWPLRSTINGEEDAAKADYREIRFFKVANKASYEPMDDCDGKWQVCTPQTAREFAAVAFYFGLNLYQTFGEPLGLINSAVGATNAKAWTSASALAPEFPHHIREIENHQASMPEYAAKYDTLLAEWKPKYDKWKAEEEEQYHKTYAAYDKASDEARRAGKEPGPWPSVVEPPSKPAVPGAVARVPSSLFNGMIAPLIPYGITGAIWYQGEGNGHRWFEYDKLMETLIADWRTRWGMGDFPFYFVQIANRHEKSVEPNMEYHWGYTREAQSKNLSIPNTGMAVTIDIGEIHEDHPRNKADVGKRLALWEMKRRGMDVAARGPNMSEVKIDGDRVIVTFKDVKKLKTKDGSDEVKGFALAGADRRYYWADARISSDNTVTVSCDKVPVPKTVRYAFDWNPDTNLYSEADLPAEPFRTDSIVRVSPGGLRLILIK